ncbi:hypothetical protein [Thiosulfativibrio zosterae]|uniref:Uncharacterized protein n=1 Tax=Thiosulfativibrio zosterae TaxID=2675053 RepID=A0A6F8PL08_9GAMM|nr:hypothetical protein [Thiosulfativibrio zosterae]BBP42744.1 hypothetical protein THMIRHAT_04900 [Thiosulfativibrio zosterae]
MNCAQLQSTAPQAQGYVLWHYVMEHPQELPLNYQLVIDDEVLQLFMQSGRNISFLVQTDNNAPQTLELHEKPPKNNQAWLFLEDFYAQNHLSPDNASNHSTLCLWVSSSALALGFRLAQQLKSDWQLVMVLESETTFPFQVKPAKFILDSWPESAAHAIGASPLLEDWRIPNRLCSPLGLPGCFEGNLTELEALWKIPASWRVIKIS